MPYPLDSEGEVDETRLRSFIGLANFSRRYIDNFAMHAYMLNGLLRKESAGIWTLAHAISYDAIKYDIAWSKGLLSVCGTHSDITKIDHKKNTPHTQRKGRPSFT